MSEQVAAARAAGRSLVIRGGGTRLFYGEPLPEGDACTWLDLSAYRGVVDYEPSELVLTARAGTPLAEIEALLDREGQMLAFEPPRFGAGDTFGGCVATGLSGPRRMAAGPVSDYVLGTRLMRADGKVMHFGGEVMKNVAGYDVSRLLVGSLGVLGPLLEVSIKVMPKPRSEITLVLALGEAEALRHCLRWRSRPIPVSATAWLPDGHLSVRLSGNESAVRTGAGTIGGEVLDPDKADAFWLALRDQTHDFFRQRPLWRVTLPPGAPSLGTDRGLHEWQGCLRWLTGAHDPVALRARVREMGGWASLYCRDGALDVSPVFHPIAPEVMQIHRRLKQQLDPEGIFNLHRLYPDF
ncbi:MAG: glycolate oxidase subunit GlcE [Rhodanobacteraceae bacterium]